MTTWFGRFWHVRLALWLSLPLFLVGWVWLDWVTHPRTLLESFGRSFGEATSCVANPLLLRGPGNVIEAWDWETNDRWVVARLSDVTFNELAIIRDGRTIRFAIVEEGERIVVYDVARNSSSKVVLQCELPEDLRYSTLLLIDGNMRYAILESDSMGEAATEPEMDLKVFDLAAKTVLDSRKSKYGFVTHGVDSLVPFTDFGPNPPPEPQQRLKLSPEGKLIEVKPLFEVPDSNDDVFEHSISPGGRWEVTQTDEGHVTVRERASKRILEKLGAAFEHDLPDYAFSVDDRYLVVGGGDDTNLVVYEVESQKQVANDQRVELRTRWSLVMGAATILPLLTAVTLAMRSPSFDRACADCVLAMLFWDCFISAIVLHNVVPIRAYASSGLVIAIGIYWTFGPRTLWLRILLGGIGFALAMAWMTTVVAYVNEHDVMSQRPSMAITSELFIATTSAVAAWMKTLRGWHLTREERVVAGKRFQFGIGTICLITTIAAVYFAFFRQLLEIVPIMEIDWMWIGFVIGILIGCLFLAIAVWLALWLVFRPWTPLSLAVACVVLSLPFVLLFLFVAWYESFSFPREFDLLDGLWRFGRAMMELSPLLSACAALVWPLWLARRHGYRWVKAAPGQPAPPLEPEFVGPFAPAAPTTMSPSDASLSPDVGSH